MSLKSRLAKLESAMPSEPEQMRISHFIVVPGQLDPPGYICDGITILRQPGESTEDLQKRCSASVEWPAGNSRQIFHPIDVGV